jgi:hypothetical protein
MKSYLPISQYKAIRWALDEMRLNKSFTHDQMLRDINHVWPLPIKNKFSALRKRFIEAGYLEKLDKDSYQKIKNIPFDLTLKDLKAQKEV